MQQITKPSHNSSFSYNIRPSVRFETQKDGEEVILVVRKHPLTQLQWIINAIFLALIGPVLGLYFLPNFLTTPYITIYFLFLIAFTFSYFWLNFLLWYFTVGIITNQRIIDLDFYNVLYKEFTATTIDQVSDLTSKIGGFFGSFFNFGDVFVKTEGFQQNIEFLDIPQPDQVLEVINILMRDKPNPS